MKVLLVHSLNDLAKINGKFKVINDYGTQIRDLVSEDVDFENSLPIYSYVIKISFETTRTDTCAIQRYIMKMRSRICSLDWFILGCVNKLICMFYDC